VGFLIIELFSTYSRLLGLAHELVKEYEQYFDTALADFCELYWPCDYENERGGRCSNVSSRHSPKGHQNARGRIIGTGSYQSSFSSILYGPNWRKLLLQKIHNLQTIAQSSQQGSVPNATDYIRIHGQNIASFYRGLGSAQNFVSHATCFCCLMEFPEHPLPCGHILCTNCVKAFGVCSPNKISYKFYSCPLHPEVARWERPCVVRFKPDYAGTRILSLDG
jgi:hypothetical protein